MVSLLFSEAGEESKEAGQPQVISQEHLLTFEERAKFVPSFHSGRRLVNFVPI